MTAPFGAVVPDVAASDPCVPSSPGVCIVKERGDILARHTFGLAPRTDGLPNAQLHTVRFHYEDPLSGDPTYQEYECLQYESVNPCLGQIVSSTPLYGVEEAELVEVTVYVLKVAWCVDAGAFRDCNGGTGVPALTLVAAGIVVIGEP